LENESNNSKRKTGRLLDSLKEIKKEKVSDEFLVQLEGERTDYSTILIGPEWK